MKRILRRAGPVVEVLLFLLFFSFSVALNLSCKDEDDPLSSGECGSGRTTWDEKAQVCRDVTNSRIVPANCCGR